MKNRDRKFLPRSFRDGGAKEQQDYPECFVFYY
jgi:hypothetical protein